MSSQKDKEIPTLAVWLVESPVSILCINFYYICYDTIDMKALSMVFVKILSNLIFQVFIKVV